MQDLIKLRYPGPYPVFFIGASAGGVRALQFLARQLPRDFPAPVFMVLHRKSSHKQEKALLNELIRHKAKMRVQVPTSGDLVKAGHIYLPSPDHHLSVADNRLMQQKAPDNAHWRPSIDVLFKSGAREYNERAVSILLTGGLDDGVEGLRETTFHGGITIAQSPEDAYDPILPLNALINDHPAYVLPLADIPALMCELSRFEFSQNQRAIAEQAAIAAVYKKQELMHA